MATAARTQDAARATPPTTMPMLACCALAGLSATIVIAKLATATDGAAENSPENAFGETSSIRACPATCGCA